MIPSTSGLLNVRVYVPVSATKAVSTASTFATVLFVEKDLILTSLPLFDPLLATSSTRSPSLKPASTSSSEEVIVVVVIVKLSSRVVFKAVASI